MNRNTFEAQMAANFIASEIRGGFNQAERMKKLKAVYAADSFTMPELTEVLDPNWKSPEQIQAEKEAEEAARKAEAEAKSAAKAAAKAARQSA